jgi:hypothetical protein
MNCRESIREHLLVNKMKYWLLRGKYGPIGNCPKWRGKKNYLFLVRKHKALAERHRFRETDAF